MSLTPNPCPFCFHENVKVNTRAKSHFVKHKARREGRPAENYACYCTRCKAKGPLAETPEQAVRKWDRAMLPEIIP